MATTLSDRHLTELEALASLIAAELANLLVPVLGNATLLEEELPEGHPLRRRARAIADAAAAARSFAQRLAGLDPTPRLAVQDSPACAMLEACLPALRASLRPEVALVIDPGVPSESVRVDRRRIEQALVELARNAQEAVAGPATVRLGAEVVTGGSDGVPEGRWLRIQVRDEGRGVDTALAARAFEPGATSKVPGGGAGFGLSIVAAVARRHGGFAGLTSNRDGGTTATLCLPVSDRAVQAARTSAARAERNPPAAPAGVVLLVEDNPMVRRSIEATLRIGGYQVLSADSGERCLELAGRREQRVDLLISDVVMPEMAGDELLDRVRGLRPDLPVLFISGYDRSSLARKHGASSEHFLQKPFDSDDLFAAVRAALADRPPSAGAT